MARKIVVRLTHGPAEEERVGGALNVAATAVASGVDVELWLTNDAVSLALDGTVEKMSLAHSPPLADLWKQVVAGARGVYACTQCLMRRDLEQSDLRDGVQQAGAAALVASVADDGAVEMSF